MALPVIPSTNKRLYGDLRASCSCTDTSNISLRGLSINNPTMSYSSISRTILPSTPETTTNGSLQNWLVENISGNTYDQTITTGHGMSEFPTGRAADTDGYLGS
jgi:hypothetical protein